MVSHRSRAGIATAIGVAAALWAPPARAQDAGPAPANARPEDVGTLDGIIAAFYDVISGPAGEPRQWQRDATLYLPGVTFSVVDRDPQTGAPRPRTVTKQEYVDRSDAFLVSAGFHEREIHRVTTRFGSVAHAWSTYEWETADGRTGRGVNGIHLAWDGDRWWITHATWDQETPDNPIPRAFLP